VDREGSEKSQDNHGEFEADRRDPNRITPQVPGGQDRLETPAPHRPRAFGPGPSSIPGEWIPDLRHPAYSGGCGEAVTGYGEDPCTQQIGDCVLVPFREIQLVCDRLKSESVDQISRIGPLQHGLGVNHWFMGRNPGRRENQRLTMTDAAQS